MFKSRIVLCNCSSPHSQVRVYGNFRKLTEKIQEYLQADSPGELFAKILERLEVDFEQGQQPRWVDKLHICTTHFYQISEFCFEVDFLLMFYF